MSENSLTLRLTGRKGEIDAEALIGILQDTLAALQEINRAASEFGSASLEWKIISAGMSSPLAATFKAVDGGSENGRLGPPVISAFVSGLQGLETKSTPPPLFSESALRYTARIARAAARGINRIQFSTGERTADVTSFLAANANEAAGKLELDRVHKSGKQIEHGSVEGILKAVESLSGKDKLVIADSVTGKETRCYFTDVSLEQKARKYWKHRVAVYGAITVDYASGEIEAVAIDELDPLGSREDLPQIEDIRGIDITGGVESSEYVRGLRDDD